MRRRLMATLTLAVIIGGISGLIAPATSSAQSGRVDVHLTINPGATNSLTCGWHEACLSPFYFGSALDWANAGNAYIYWRSYGWRSDTTGQVATGTVGTSNTGCSRMLIDVRDVYGYSQGISYYTHSWTPWNGHPVRIDAGGGFWQGNNQIIGYTYLNERADFPNCPTSGSHLHQYASGYGQNTGLYPGAPGTGTYPVTNNGYWQNDRRWCWFC